MDTARLLLKIIFYPVNASDNPSFVPIEKAFSIPLNSTMGNLPTLLLTQTVLPQEAIFQPLPGRNGLWLLYQNQELEILSMNNKGQTQLNLPAAQPLTSLLPTGRQELVLYCAFYADEKQRLVELREENPKPNPAPYKSTPEIAPVSPRQVGAEDIFIQPSLPNYETGSSSSAAIREAEQEIEQISVNAVVDKATPVEVRQNKTANYGSPAEPPSPVAPTMTAARAAEAEIRPVSSDSILPQGTRPAPKIPKEHVENAWEQAREKNLTTDPKAPPKVKPSKKSKKPKVEASDKKKASQKAEKTVKKPKEKITFTMPQMDKSRRSLATAGISLLSLLPLYFIFRQLPFPISSIGFFILGVSVSLLVIVTAILSLRLIPAPRSKNRPSSFLLGVICLSLGILLLIGGAILIVAALLSQT